MSANARLLETATTKAKIGNLRVRLYSPSSRGPGAIPRVPKIVVPFPEFVKFFNLPFIYLVNSPSS